MPALASALAHIYADGCTHIINKFFLEDGGVREGAEQLRVFCFCREPPVTLALSNSAPS